jgi:Fe-S-cluster containining protein
MDSRPTQSVSDDLPGDDLPQIVPSDLCLRCDVCCRFPERESFLRPYFTARERERAIAAGLNANLLPEPAGGKIRLIPHPTGDGYVCPAFDTATQHCRIYSVRPLDCRLYPLALMHDEEGRRRVLGLDSKCPYVQDPLHEPQLADYARRMASRLREPAVERVLADNPGLINPYQDDVRSIGEVGDGGD